MVSHLVIIFIAILITGILTASKVAILTVNTAKLQNELGEESELTKYIIDNLKESNKAQIAIQTAISTLSLLIGMYAATNLYPFISNSILEYSSVGSENSGDIAYLLMDILVVIVFAMIVSIAYILVAEMIPHKIGLNKQVPVIKFMVKPLKVIIKVTKPYTFILTAIANVCFKSLKLENNDELAVTEEEIRLMVNTSGEAGHIDENEIEMIQNIFEFDDKSVGDICVHRLDVMAVSINSDPQEIMDIVKEQKYSRIPIYEENIDNIIGIIYVKDIFKSYITNGNTLTQKDIKDLLRKPYFVPFSSMIDELFRDMQKNQTHMCIVVDEYGGTTGIVTMEDIVEEIMGNILDEYDEVEVPDIDEIDVNTYKVNGATDLDELVKFFDVQLPVDDYDTVGGFIIGQLGRVPEDNENPEVEFNGILFKISEIVDKRIKSLTVVRLS